MRDGVMRAGAVKWRAHATGRLSAHRRPTTWGNGFEDAALDEVYVEVGGAAEGRVGPGRAADDGELGDLHPVEPRSLDRSVGSPSRVRVRSRRAGIGPGATVPPRSARTRGAHLAALTDDERTAWLTAPAVRHDRSSRSCPSAWRRTGGTREESRAHTMRGLEGRGGRRERSPRSWA